MRLARRGVFGATLVVALTIGATAAVAKRGLVVTDFESEQSLRVQAMSLTLLVRSHLRSSNRPGISRGALRTALGKQGGAKEFLVVDDGQVAKVLTAAGADRLIKARIERNGPGIRVYLRVLDEGGIELGKAKLDGKRGDVGPLAGAITRKAAELAGELVTVRRPRISIGQLRAFIRAGRALNTSDHASAIQALTAARRGVGNRVIAAREIADTLLADSTIPFEQRAIAAIASGNTIELAKQVAAERSVNRKSELATAAAAFLALERTDPKAAAKELRRVRRSKHRFVLLIRADLEHRRRNSRARNRLLDSLLDRTPYVPALAFIADLPPGSLGPPLEGRVLTAAIAVRDKHPGLAAILGARAARGGIQPAAALALVDAAELDSTELASLKPLIDKTIKSRQAVGHRLTAEIHLRDGDLAEARKSVTRGLALDRNDQKLKDHRTTLEASDAADDVDLTDDGDKDRLAATKRLSDDSKKKQSSTMEALRVELGALLASFPALSTRQVSSVAVVELPGNGEPFYMPRQVVPSQLRDGLVLTLRSPPFELTVKEAAGTVRSTSKTDYERVVADQGVHAVLAYGISTRGSEAQLTLVLYNKGTGKAKEFSDRIDGPSVGLVVWNRGFLGIVGFVLFLIVAFVVWKLIRPTGTMIVGLNLDTDASDQTLAIQLSRSSKRPVVANMSDFTEKMRKTGADTSPLYCALVGRSTRFESVSTGRWWVHVYGTFSKAGELRALPEEHSQQVRLRRGTPLHVKFDLVPKTTEYRLRVYDGEQPVKDAEVWLDDDRGSAVKTPRTGDVMLDLTRGEHVIRIVVGRMRIEKVVDVTDAKVHNLTVNLQRERRLSRVREGIEIDSDDTSQAEIVDASGRSIGASAAAGLSKAARGPAHPAVTGAPVVSFGLSASKDASSAATMAPPTRGDASSAATMAPPASDSAAAAAAAAAAGGGTAAYSGAPTGLQRYRPIQELGRGAMGVVYRASDTVLERDVALKVMSEAVRQYPAALQMFLQEAKALAALNHSNIVTVFDQGHDDGQPFMVMEWVEGTTLEDILEKEQRLDLERAVDLADQICAGLAYAHGRRIIHRDIKPANIFITPDGTVKIGDFGLARVMNELKIKQTEIKGTPLYMSPEQIYGKDMDFRSDLYSVGCTLFEVVAGRPPFIDGEILYHHVNTPPPKPSEFRPDMPAALETLILRCIAKDKDQRIESADAMRKALKSIRAMLS